MWNFLQSIDSTLLLNCLTFSKGSAVYKRKEKILPWPTVIHCPIRSTKLTRSLVPGPWNNLTALDFMTNIYILVSILVNANRQYV